MSARRLRDAVAARVGLLAAAAAGRATGEELRRMERRARAPEEMRRFQSEQLAELLRHAGTHVPFYRERFRRAGVAVGDVSPATAASVLASLPPLTKADVREGGEALLAVDRPRKATVGRTSGSSGQPIVVHTDHEQGRTARAAQRRAYRWYGVEPTEPRVMVLGPPVAGKDWLKRKVVDLLTSRRLHEFHGDDQLRDVARLILRYRPAIVTAYPSVLVRLCEVAERHGIRLRDAAPRLLHTQSELLLDAHRERLRDAFGPVPLLNEYGCVEVGAMAYSCPEAATLHVSHDHCVLEVVGASGEPLEAGTGSVLLTPLRGLAMPLLRYDVGDEATIGPGRCTCGRMSGLPELRSIEGRVFERILAADGQRSFSGGLVHFLVRRADPSLALREYVAVQRRPGHLLFLVVPTPSFRPDFAERLQAEVREHLDPGMEVSCEMVERIPRPGRKQRYFVSELTA